MRLITFYLKKNYSSLICKKFSNKKINTNKIDPEAQLNKKKQYNRYELNLLKNLEFEREKSKADNFTVVEYMQKVILFGYITVKNYNTSL